MGIVNVDNTLPSVVSDSSNDSAVVVGTQADSIVIES